jgi:hypothetical protein
MHRRVVLFIALLAALALGAPGGTAAKSPFSYAPTAAEAQQATTACGPGAWETSGSGISADCAGARRTSTTTRFAALDICSTGARSRAGLTA